MIESVIGLSGEDDTGNLAINPPIRDIAAAAMDAPKAIGDLDRLVESAGDDTEQ